MSGDAATTLPMLEIRRIEARMLKHVYDTLKASHGVEVAQATIAEAVRASSVEQARAMAAGVGGRTSMQTFIDRQTQWTMGGALEVEEGLDPATVILETAQGSQMDQHAAHHAGHSRDRLQHHRTVPIAPPKKGIREKTEEFDEAQSQPVPEIGRLMVHVQNAIGAGLCAADGIIGSGGDVVMTCHCLATHGRPDSSACSRRSRRTIAQSRL